MDGLDLEDKWLEQVGATYHTSREPIALLHETFPSWSCNVTFVWPELAA